MGRKPMRNPSFFKVLIDNDFTRQLKVPPVFAQKYRGILPENAIFRISSGETWDVRLEQMGDEHYYFTRGWKKFLKDMALEKFEFLVFWFVGNSTFDVSVYGITGCEKVSNTNFRVEDCGEAHVEFISDHKCMNHDGASGLVKNVAALTDDETKPDNSNPRFEMVLKTYQSSRVVIGKHFAEASGLIGEEKVGMEYYPGGHNSYVEVDLRSFKPHFRLDLAAGWPEFRKANGLIYGKTYSFEFIPSKKVIQVKEVKFKRRK